MKSTRIVWTVRSARLAMAAYRLRCLAPSVYLCDLGWNSVVLSNARQLIEFQPEPNDILIVSKDLTSATLALAQRFHEKSRPILFDLCDPTFIPEYRGGRDIAGAKFLETFLPLVQKVTTSSPRIAMEIKHYFPDVTDIGLIPDPVLLPPDIDRLIHEFQKSGHQLGERVHVSPPDGSGRFTDALRYWFRRYLLRPNFSRRYPRRKRLVWFGKSGNEYARHGGIAVGFRALDQWKVDLIKLNKAVPIELAVMSNATDKFFRRHFGDWPFPVSYAEWSLLGFQMMMQNADLALVPVGNDRIALCSSGNRVTQSLGFGLPVVGRALDGLEDLQPFYGTDKPYLEALAYLTDTELRTRHLAEAQKILVRDFSPQAVAQQWQKEISAAIAANGYAEPARA